MIKIKNFLEKNNIEFYEDFYIGKVSSIKLGDKAKIVIYPHTVIQLKRLLKFFYVSKIYYRVFGNLSNVLIIEKIDYPIIITNKMKTEIEREGNIVTVSAGTLISKLFEYMKKNELSGIEAISGIPATIGGALYCNAGAFGSSISDNLVSVEVFCEGKCLILRKNEIKFGYHFSSLSGFVVLSATFLFENKKEYEIIKLFNEFTFRRNN